jgi:hypothetical protein
MNRSSKTQQLGQEARTALQSCGDPLARGAAYMIFSCLQGELGMGEVLTRPRSMLIFILGYYCCWKGR